MDINRNAIPRSAAEEYPAGFIRFIEAASLGVFPYGEELTDRMVAEADILMYEYALTPGFPRDHYVVIEKEPPAILLKTKLSPEMFVRRREKLLGLDEAALGEIAAGLEQLLRRFTSFALFFETDGDARMLAQLAQVAGAARKRLPQLGYFAFENETEPVLYAGMKVGSATDR